MLSLISVLGITTILGVCKVSPSKWSMKLSSLSFCRLGLLPLSDLSGTESSFFRQNVIRSHPSSEILLFPSHMQPPSERWRSLQFCMDRPNGGRNRPLMHCSSDYRTAR